MDKSQTSNRSSMRTPIEAVIMGVSTLLSAGVLSFFDLEFARNLALLIGVALTIFGAVGIFRAKKAKNTENSN